MRWLILVAIVLVSFEGAMVGSMKLGGLPWRWVWWRWLAWHRITGGRPFDPKDLSDQERRHLLIVNGFTPRDRY